MHLNDLVIIQLFAKKKLILLESKELYEKLKYKPFSSIKAVFQSEVYLNY
jgi:hypothetical protein